jgi:hypothetical protein
VCEFDYSIEIWGELRIFGRSRRDGWETDKGFLNETLEGGKIDAG